MKIRKEEEKTREIAAIGINAPIITKNARLKRNILSKGPKKEQIEPLQREDSNLMLLS